MTIRTEESVDVLVVGARCAGASIAMLLARAGLDVLVVDRAEAGADTLSTHALMRPGVLLLSQWGVLDAVRSAGTPRVTDVVYHYGADTVPIPIRPRGDVDGLYAPRRTVLDPILVDAAHAAGAEVRHGVSFQDVERDVDGRVVGARLRSRDGREVVVRCRWLIGADGLRSRVARAVDATVVHRAAHTSTNAYAFVEGLPDTAYHNLFRPGVAAGLIPTNGGMANVWAGVSSTAPGPHDPRDVPAFFEHTLRAASPWLADQVFDGRAVEGLRLFSGHRGETRRAYGPGWALVGDAASMEDPIGAHGMTKALIGAELTARAVVQAAHGADERAAFAGFATTRMLLARKMLGPLARMLTSTQDTPALQEAHVAAGEALRAEWDTLARLAQSGRTTAETQSRHEDTISSIDTARKWSPSTTSRVVFAHPSVATRMSSGDENWSSTGTSIATGRSSARSGEPASRPA
jgi:menaquinone-9 beta-reductase